MMRHPILPIIASALLLGTSFGTPSRGVWFWGSTTLPGGGSSTHGSSTVVGDDTEENAAIAFMTSRGVTRVYGSYQNRPVSEPSVIATWNAKLDAAGIDSQILIDGTAVNDPAHLTSIQSKITNRLINFNNTLAPDEASKFDALHLDIEPQQLDLWKDDTVGTDKRTLLTDLANAYTAIRSQLDSAGLTDIPIYADINFSWDKLPIDGGSVAWANETDRNNWYAGIGADLAGLTIMTFSKDTSAELATATDFERTGSFPGSVVVGIQPRTGIGELWSNYTAFYNVMLQLESDIGTAEATDIENYAFWRHAVATNIPGLPALPQIYQLDEVDGGGVIISGTAFPGYKYVVEENDDLSDVDGWAEVGEFRSPFPDRIQPFEYPAPTDLPHCFWRINRTEEP